MKLKAKEPAKRVSEALPLIGVTHSMFSRMLELGFFTEYRPSLVSSRGIRLVFEDEIREFQRRVAEGLPRERILKAMKQHRAEMGRLKK